MIPLEVSLFASCASVRFLNRQFIVAEPQAAPLKRLRLSYSTPPDLVHRVSSLHPQPEELTGSIGRAASQRTASLSVAEEDIQDEERPWSGRSATPKRSFSPSIASGRAKSPSLHLSALLRYNEQQQDMGQSRRASQGNSIPIRAIVTPRPASATLSRRGSDYFMRDPSINRPGSRATNYSSLASKGDRWARIRVVPVEAWCFILGFFLPFFWWGGSISKTKLAIKLSRHPEEGRGWPPDKGGSGSLLTSTITDLSLAQQTVITGGDGVES